jgi:hypothetical protein
MSAFLGDFINTYERAGIPDRTSAFVRWSNTHFPRVTEIKVIKQYDYTIVEGRTDDDIPLFTLRHVRDVVPPTRVNSEYVYFLWDKHGEQRIHVSDFQDFFGDWIRENFPKVKYVYINAYNPNKWVLSLDDDFTFEVHDD